MDFRPTIPSFFMVMSVTWSVMGSRYETAIPRSPDSMWQESTIWYFYFFVLILRQGLLCSFELSDVGLSSVCCEYGLLSLFYKEAAWFPESSLEPCHTFCAQTWGGHRTSLDISSCQKSACLLAFNPPCPQPAVPCKLPGTLPYILHPYLEDRRAASRELLY